MRIIRIQNSIGVGRRRRNALRVGIGILLFGVLLSFGRGVFADGNVRLYLREGILGKIQEKTCQTYLPVFSFMEDTWKKQRDVPYLVCLFTRFFPLYEYGESHSGVLGQGESQGILEWQAEGEASYEKEGESPRMDEQLLEAMMEENGVLEDGEEVDEEEAMQGFVEAEKVLNIDRTALTDFNRLVAEFYAVDSTTYIGRDQLDVEKLLAKDMTLAQKDTSMPQILIYHTHSQEAFADSVPGDKSTTIIGAGEHLAQILREKYGFNVLHHMGEYDVESRDYAYSNAAPALEQVLAENPSIEVIIDLHRDSVPADKKLMVDIGGRPTAKFMFFNGLSRTNKTGEIDYLKNPYLDENLAFSFQMQLASNEYYPGLTRKIYLKGYRYNMQYRGKSLLIELGAQTNTVEEIMNACDPLAHVLYLVLSGEE